MQHVSGDPSLNIRGRGRIASVRDEEKTLHQNYSLLYVDKLLLLLQRYISDAKKITALVSIIPYMKLDLFGLQRKEKVYKSIIATVRDIFFRHSALPVLDACSKTMTFCMKSAPNAMLSEGRRLIRDCSVELEAKLSNAEAVFQSVSNSEEFNDPDLESLKLAFVRMLRLESSGSGIVSVETFDKVRAILTSYTSDSTVTLVLLQIMFSWIQWILVAYEDNSSSVSIVNVSDRISSFVSISCKILDSKAANKFKARVHSILVECLILQKGVLDKFQDKDVIPNKSVATLLWKFCEGNLEGFDSDESVEKDDDTFGNDFSDAMYSSDVEDIYRHLEHRDEISSIPLKIVAATARLVAFDVIPIDSCVAEMIVSHYVEHGTLCANIIKGMIRIIRQRTDLDPWELYFGALKCSFERYLSDTTDVRFALFQDLATRVSAAYGGVNFKGKPHIIQLLQKCTTFGIMEAPLRLEFIEVMVSSFASRLSPEGASQL